MKPQYDLLIIGAGPAGLSAAINAASEGLKVIVCDSANSYGGQAAGSSLIENYPGFPKGISGLELANIFVEQATKFGAIFKNPFKVIAISKADDGIFTVYSDDGAVLFSNSILITTGLQYKPVPIKGIDRFIGNGVVYGSPNMNEDYIGKRIAIVGGANSAGQAATFLADCNSDVHLIIRGNSVEEKMSSYLSSRVLECNRIIPHLNSEIDEVFGDEKGLKYIQISDANSVAKLPIDKLFVLIGSEPRTSWIQYVTKTSKEGLIFTGRDVIDYNKNWREEFDREPLSMEAYPGVFVAGDVRHGSVKRIASAVGEGARVVNSIHTYLSVQKVNLVSLS